MNPVKRMTALLLIIAALACGKHEHEEAEAPEREGLTFTHFTDRTELFVEFDALAKGAESAFAAHVTRLSDFKPLATGTVTAILSEGGAPEERFTANAPSVPGIFRPVAKPQHAGRRRLVFEIAFDGAVSRHDLGMMTVFESEQAAIAAAPKEEEAGGGIVYLKEQQWKTEFATAPVAEGEVRGSVPANGVLRPRPDGEARVGAPAGGRFLARGNYPQIGMTVARNQVLGVIAPRVPTDVDPSSLNLDVQRAQIALQQAQAERTRLEALLAQEAIPERRVTDARRAEQTARADLQAAQSRLAQYRGTQSATGGESGGRFEVRSPVAGTIVAVTVAPGEFVEDGRELFHVVDLTRLWLELQIPEGQIGQVQSSNSVWFQPEGFPTAFEVGPAAGGRVVASGGVVSEKTRTLPLIFEVPNRNGQLKSGMFVRAQVFTAATQRGIVIPLSSVVDEDGQPVAYVELEGELFERRPLKTGTRQGDVVQILEGLEPGDRVVTRGAYNIRLQAASGAVPAHGHAH
ncbi:MAG TPA: efflux RND transporter periplasmic adaptor subunit [Thermoanaerobaculia bacterium]